MAEILLTRGKRTDNGKWVEGYYVHLHDDKGHESHRIYTSYAESDCGEFYPDWYEVAPKTVGQYTGLTDKNGKKIFEGDICTYPDGYVDYAGDGVETLSIGVVTWDSKQPSFYITENIGVEWEEIWDSLDEITVIGNIHDNPDLLKESEGGENG